MRSIVATPVMSMTTTVARFSWIAPRSCSVSWRAREESRTPMIGRMSRRSRSCRTGVDSSRMRLLLLVDDPLALLDEAHPDRHRDPVGRRLVRVEDAIEELEVLLVLGEQRTRQHVAQEEHDPEHLVRLDAAGDDPLRELAGVGLEVLDAAGLQGVDVVVVDLGRLGEDLLVRHHAQQLRLADAPRPLLAQLGAVVAQVRHQLLQQRVGVFRALSRLVVRRADPAPRLRPLDRALGPSAPPRVWVGRVPRPHGNGGLMLVHRSRGPRARAPSRKRPVIVAIMSSLPSGGVDVSTPTIKPDQRLGQASARDVVADVAGGLAPLEQLAQRLGEPALEPLGVGSHAARAPGARRSPRRRRARARPGRCPPRAPPRRSWPTPAVHRRRSPRPAPARRAGPAGSGSSGRPWPGRLRPRRRRRSCSPARPRARTSARRRRGSPRRRAAATLVWGLARTSSSRR